MEKNDIADIATRYMQIWNAGQSDLLSDFASAELNVEYTHFGKVYHGIEAYRQVLNQIYRYFVDIKTTIDEVYVCENKAFIKWTYTGTHLNDNLFGIEPTGQKVSGFVQFNAFLLNWVLR